MVRYRFSMIRRDSGNNNAELFREWCPGSSPFHSVILEQTVLFYSVFYEQFPVETGDSDLQLFASFLLKETVIESEINK